jgi:hypothetical protein
MNNKPLHPALRLVGGGALSLILLCIWRMPGRDPRWHIVIGGMATAAFVLLVPVLLRGDSWQKMLAGLLLFLPSFGLVLALVGVVGSL